MDGRTCNVCFGRFSDGYALGRHIRSHVTSTAPRSRSCRPGDSHSSVSSGHAASERDVEEEEAVEVGLSYGLRVNLRKNFRLVDSEFSSSSSSSFAADEPAGPCVVVPDWESETESPRARRLRTKKRRLGATALTPDQPDAEPASSVSYATPDEDVALCLMMLSRDSWAAARSRPPLRRGRSRHQCDACKKVFRSYQALGGHRASHKRINGCVPAVERRVASSADGVDTNADARVYECPFCFRVFSSGQALGGHKRSHFMSSVTNKSPSSTSPVPAVTNYVRSFGLIDLNLPAPADDDVELSAISDTEVPFPTSTCGKHAI
ncbi:zinc finger protein ZAT9-like [Musa acuminata AAA Group]|uniref:zinc finger protein ZAT9-like n=1 Tax=Musa acuminata AAA Group TaxID=214697 RepID=UPI0031CFEAA9